MSRDNTPRVYSTTEWLRMFETLCARYKCRSIEEISFESDEDLCASGPGGIWLAEVTSVEFDERGALLDACCASLRRFGRRVFNTIDANAATPSATAVRDRRRDKGITLAVDWFVDGCQRARHCERRQCLVKACRNSRLITVMLLTNTVRHANVPPNGLAFSRHVERLRPFAFVLVCELVHRRIDFELLNMHFEPMESTARWRAMLRATANAEEEEYDNHEYRQQWLNVGRDAHSRAKWLRVIRTTVTKYDLLDSIVTQRTPGSGRIQYLWRDGRSLSAYGVNPLANGTLLHLGDLDTELHSARSCVSKLCDFDVFHRRCGHMLVYAASPTNLDRPMAAASSSIGGLVNNDDIDDERIRIRKRGYGCYGGLAALTREKTYYIDHEGTLRCSRFVALS